MVKLSEAMKGLVGTLSWLCCVECYTGINAQKGTRTHTDGAQTTSILFLLENMLINKVVRGGGSDISFDSVIARTTVFNCTHSVLWIRFRLLWAWKRECLCTAQIIQRVRTKTQGKRKKQTWCRMNNLFLSCVLLRNVMHISAPGTPKGPNSNHSSYFWHYICFVKQAVIYV